MSVILSIETATTVCSVAIHDSGRIVASEELFVERSHSTRLHSSIEHLMKIAELSFSELKAVAISKGPGSYTGLRIGTSAAKGICFAHDIPLIGVNTLEGMANMASNYIRGEGLLCPMIDARRQEVYCLVVDGEGNTIMSTEAKIIDEYAFQDLLSENIIYFFGNGAPKSKQLLGFHPNALFLDSVHTSALGIGALAWKSYQQQVFENVAYFEPLYLKDFKVKRSSKKLDQ